MNMQKIRVGIDFDGVIANKSPLISKKLVEKLFKGCKEDLHYRFPKSKTEQFIRKVSHFYLLRPPLRRNLKLVKKLGEDPRYELYLITSRYSFLENETYTWIKKKGLDKTFSEYILNLKDEQPHIFKREVLKRLKLDYYFEDDQSIADFLEKELEGLKIVRVVKDGDKSLKKMVTE